jgi:prepilin-type processing-associated H-X9-DG protein
VKPGIFLLTSNLTTGWTREMHKSAGVPCGNMAFVDGHVELLKKSLSAVIERQELSTNKLVFP